MEENMAEEMENEDAELLRNKAGIQARKKARKEFYDKYGMLNDKTCLIALRAIKEGRPFYLTTEHFRANNPKSDHLKLDGKELQDWGLDLDTLLCPPPKKGTPEYHEWRIL